MSVSWSRIQENVISAVIIGIVAGAGAIVWKGATTVDEKVNDANAGLEQQTTALQEQADYIKKAIGLLEREARESKRRDDEIIQALNELREEKEALKSPEIPEEDFIQRELPKLDVRQMRFEVPRR